MDSTVAWEILVIVGLVLANGFFAAAEIALVAARRGRLEQMANAGDRGARIALDLANNPDRFLPTVQVGITLIGTFAAVFGGARIVAYLDLVFSASPIDFLQQYSGRIALWIVVLGITVLSVVLGELVPKRIALERATSLSRVVSIPIYVVAQVARPAVSFLRLLTNLVLWPLGFKASASPDISLEDIRHLIQLGTTAGVLEPVEQKVALEALQLGDRKVTSIMRPRIDIDALDVDTPPREVLGTIAMAGFSRLPIYEKDLDHIIGYVHLKDVVRQQYLGWPIDLRKLRRPALFVPATMPIDRLLVLLQEQNNSLAIILDEFGGTEGLVTLEDVLHELVGEIVSDRALDHDQQFVRRDDASWLVDGRAPIEDLCERLGIAPQRSAPDRGYATVAGLVLSQLGRIPVVGDRTQWEGHLLEVVDMDGQRIDRVLVAKAGVDAPPAA